MVQSTFLTEEIISSIYKKDVSLKHLTSSNPDGEPGNIEFKEKDLPLYSVILTTYTLVLEDRILSAEKRSILIEAIVDRLKRFGLIAYIKESDEFFSEWVKTTEIPQHPVFTPLLETILSTDYSDLMSIQVAGEIFRFMKRFAPYGTVGLAAKCVEEFWRNESYNKNLDRVDHPYGSAYWCITGYVREKTKHLFRNWEKYQEEFEKREVILPDGETQTEYGDYYGRVFLSPNAIQHVCKNTLCKKILLESAIGDVLNEEKGFPNPIISPAVFKEINDLRTTKYAEAFDPANTYVGWNYVIGNPVPKKFDSDRMVAPDRVVEYHLQMKTELKLRRVIEDNRIADEDLSLHVPIHDQALQRARAQQGSIDAMTDTLDFSSASDLHRKSVVSDLYPNDIATELRRNVPLGIKIGKNKHALYMFAPMGSPLTFRTMQLSLFMVLYACTLFAAKIFNWTAERTQEALRRIGVFGDDVTCDKEVTELYIQWIELLGFKVNQKKSYTQKGKNFTFRESCGGDYINGVDVSAHYWPRKQFQVGKNMLLYWHVDGFTGEMDDSLSVMINLSKAIRKFSERAAIYLNSICRKVEPKLTMSEIGSSNPDLWSSVCLTRPRKSSPHLLWRNGRYQYHYFHTTFKEGLIKEGESRLVRVHDIFELTEESYRRFWEEYRDFVKCKGTVLEKLYEYPITRPDAPAGWTEKNGLKAWRYITAQSFASAKLDSHEQSYLECRSVPQMKITERRYSTNEDVCIVESVLAKHHIDLTQLLEYYSYLDFLEKGVFYADPLDELLGVTTRKDSNQLFGNKTVNWTLSEK